MSATESLFQFAYRRALCALRGHVVFADYYGRFEGEYVCIGCGKRKVVTE